MGMNEEMIVAYEERVDTDIRLKALKIENMEHSALSEEDKTYMLHSIRKISEVFTQNVKTYKEKQANAMLKLKL